MYKFLLLLIFAMNAIVVSAQNADVLRVESNYKFEKTAELLMNNLNDKGIPIFAIIDHSQNARRVNLSLPPTRVFIFGSPEVGTLLMQKNQDISLDLPLKISVMQTASNEVWVSYLNMVEVAKKYSLEKHPAIIKIQKLLVKITEDITE